MSWQSVSKTGNSTCWCTPAHARMRENLRRAKPEINESVETFLEDGITSLHSYHFNDIFNKTVTQTF